MDSHRDLVAVGYQDNSFVIYSILQGFKPLYRGCEHRSFLSQVKFDNWYMKKYVEHRMNTEQEEVKGNINNTENEEEVKIPSAAMNQIGAEETKK